MIGHLLFPRRSASLAKACTALALTGLLTGAALADDGKPQHYEAVKPASLGEARTVLAASLKDIEAALKSGDFERIHQISYSTENAAAVIVADAAADPDLSERLTRTIEIVHQASEIPDAAILATAVPRLKDITDKTLAGN